MGMDAQRREQFSQEMAEIQGGALSALGDPIGGLRECLAEAETPRASAGQAWQWDVSDFNAMLCMTLLERRYQPFVIPTPTVAEKPRRRLQVGLEIAGWLSHYHGALPYAVAERRVLADVCGDDLMHLQPPKREAEMVDRVQGIEVAVISGGLQKVVHGRDLMRRWWSWRRQTDEFTGQGSLDVAREALDEMDKLLVLRAKR